MINSIICGDCLDVMANMDAESVDLIVTSPPYDDLRDYEGYKFNFEKVADAVFRALKQGGVACWIVGDRIVDGDRTLTSFKQGLHFKGIGFRMHDIVVYVKDVSPTREHAYCPAHELMFVLSKGQPKTAHIRRMPTKHPGVVKRFASRKNDGERKTPNVKPVPDDKAMPNVWEYAVGYGKTTADNIAYKHPAVFPEKLAADCITSWSNPGDLVLDPMCGSGTVPKMAFKLGRRYIGIDISREYCDIAGRRVDQKQTIFGYTI